MRRKKQCLQEITIKVKLHGRKFDNEELLPLQKTLLEKSDPYQKGCTTAIDGWLEPSYSAKEGTIV